MKHKKPILDGNREILASAFLAGTIRMMAEQRGWRLWIEPTYHHEGRYVLKYGRRSPYTFSWNAVTLVYASTLDEMLDLLPDTEHWTRKGD